MKAIENNKFLSGVWDYVILTFGILLYSFTWESFFVPNAVTDGGMTGACAILEIATGGRISLSTSYLVVNVCLIVLSVFVLGKGFGIKTLYCILLSSVMLRIFEGMDAIKCIEGQFFYIDNKLMIALIGGALEAISIGIVLQRGGSTGGTDIIAMIINKFWPISPGRFYLVTDVIIISTLVLIPGKSFVDVTYGYVVMLTFSFMVDFVLLGRKSTMQILVFSERYADIADHVIHNMDRGATVLKAIGWYTKTEKDVLLILVRKYEVHEVTKVIKDLDPKAFVSVSPASSVYGEGFDEIKTGLNKKSKNIPQSEH